jgi:CIC family chloride channel protein
MYRKTAILRAQELRYILISAAIGLLIGLVVSLYLEFFKLIDSLRLALISINLYFNLILTVLAMFTSYLTIARLAYTKTTGCGTHIIISSYNFRSGFIDLRDTLIKPIASAITIGLGCSAGLEGPSLVLGGGFASKISQILDLKPEAMRIMMISGAAAGLSAVFKAPLTGIFFALEIPYKRDIAKEAFIPASIASITSYLTLVTVKGTETLFPFVPRIIIPSIYDVLHSIILGLLATVVGVLFVKLHHEVTHLSRRLNVKEYFKPIVGGAIVGLIVVINPYTSGTGYEVIRLTLENRMNIQPSTIEALMLLKIIATSVTLSFGGSGGLFIPTIYVGALLGLAYTSILTGFREIYVMAAMASLLSATSKTLFTPVVFVAETCGPSSIIPTIIASTVSFFASGLNTFYEDQLIKEAYEEELALEEAYIFAKETKPNILEDVKAKDVMTVKPIALNTNKTVKDALKDIKGYNFRVYPIINNDGKLEGYITLETLLSIPKWKHNIQVGLVALRTPITTLEDEPIINVIEDMIRKAEDHAFVVSSREDMRLVGVIAAIDIVRKILQYTTA